MLLCDSLTSSNNKVLLEKFFNDKIIFLIVEANHVYLAREYLFRRSFKVGE